MNKYPYALFNAFSENAYGGSKAALVSGAEALSGNQMQHLAQEFAVPATGFITKVENNSIDIRFFSTQTEYPMCGHATIALATWLYDKGQFATDNSGNVRLTLNTPQSTALLNVSKREDGRLQVMLELQSAKFSAFELDHKALYNFLGITSEDKNHNLSTSITHSDFVHLILPINSLTVMESMKPNFDAITTFCRQQGIDTIMAFTMQTNHRQHTVHCREFAPAVGTPEAPASGTTNRALACYLFQNRLINFPQNGMTTIISEQGFEMGKPSLIETELGILNGDLESVKVGGVATQVIEGMLYFD